MWISGSPSSSIIRLSSSVFSPSITSRTRLPLRPRDVANHAFESREQRTDRHHARVHHALLDAVADAVELMDRLAQFVDRRMRPSESLDFAADGLQVGLDASGLAPEGIQFRPKRLPIASDPRQPRLMRPAR